MLSISDLRQHHSSASPQLILLPANAIAVTASPANQNGLKITIGSKALMDDEIAQLALLDQPLSKGAGPD